MCLSHVFRTAGSPVTLRLASGMLPDGLRVDPAAKALIGTPTNAGVHVFSLEAHDDARKALRTFGLKVTGPNLAPLASEILASVKPWTGGSEVPTPGGIPRPWLSNTSETFRDGKLSGDGQTYLAPLPADFDQVLHFGYRREQPPLVGMLRVVTGVVGGLGVGLGGIVWMDRALVEYLDAKGEWLPVLALNTEPSLPPGTPPVDKPHHGSYAFSFAPVKTTGIRLAAILPISTARRPPAASIAELELY